MDSRKTGTNICFRCGKDDAVQSVPAIVMSGTARGVFSGPSGSIMYIDGKSGYSSGYSHLSGTMTSDLARALAAPLPPKEISFWTFVGWSWLFLFSICIIIGPFLVWPRFKEAVAPDPDDQTKVFTPDVKSTSIILLIIGWHPMAWPFIFPLKNKIINRLNYPLKYREWQVAYNNWLGLLYCHRCGVVIDPSVNN